MSAELVLPPRREESLQASAGAGQVNSNLPSYFWKTCYLLIFLTLFILKYWYFFLLL